MLSVIISNESALGIYVGSRDVKGTGFCGTGGTGTAKLFFLRDGTGIFGTAGQAKTGQNGIPQFFSLIKNYYQGDSVNHFFFQNRIIEL